MLDVPPLGGRIKANNKGTNTLGLCVRQITCSHSDWVPTVRHLGWMCVYCVSFLICHVQWPSWVTVEDTSTRTS